MDVPWGYPDTRRKDPFRRGSGAHPEGGSRNGWLARPEATWRQPCRSMLAKGASASRRVSSSMVRQEGGRPWPREDVDLAHRGSPRPPVALSWRLDPVPDRVYSPLGPRVPPEEFHDETKVSVDSPCLGTGWSEGVPQPATRGDKRSGGHGTRGANGVAPQRYKRPTPQRVTPSILNQDTPSLHMTMPEWRGRRCWEGKGRDGPRLGRVLRKSSADGYALYPRRILAETHP
jgi:hypothetical protein